MSPTIAVGCPVRDRAWVMDRWFEHTEDACAYAGLSPLYVFVADPSDPTLEVIGRYSQHAEIVVVHLDEEPLPAAELSRQGWAHRSRLEHMVEVRNALLARVRSLQPDLFWSVDSDILVQPATLTDALETLERGYGAVGSLTWMCDHTYDWPSFGTWDPSNGGLRRFRAEPGVLWRTDIIMAVKLMSPAAYLVDYQVPAFGSLGEDIGWSLACRDVGVSLAVDGRHPCKHVLTPALLDRIDLRVGF